ncbi:phycobiliprotein lyase [Merismopedia glauca]|uniref:Chromophore lyase CpcS/CpeS n=1 Tax=Merismopedia glauca CCAP 1448/3 TaxID=1296344 RepID=A0A2T1C3R9_9CYAN|nr:phycobiliprotein lyase [Merismopedia glauca]PSB02899.1 phycobiliprotein lyase [Merismopedia glauca CCAP 1448/3]
MEAIEFFQLSAGKWRSQRTTHHLPFRRSEIGESEVQVAALSAHHPEIISLCEYHQIEPKLTVGGCLVTWQGTMAWDRENDENHEGKTVFALVPSAENPKEGKLLRERGYAEIVPVVGNFYLDDENGLVLTTEYETMSSVERFSFVGSNIRMRTSTVKRFGGFSTASFCVETRLDTETSPITTGGATPQVATNVSVSQQFESVLGW